MRVTDNAILNTALQMAGHAADRQAVVTQNIAHANTPGYKARDIASFADVFLGRETSAERLDKTAAVKPNGNSVSLEDQVLNLTQTRGQHEMAIGLFERTVTLYQTALGRGR